EFLGYKNLLQENHPDQCTILALYRDGQFVDSLNPGEKGSVILDRSPFYAEAGGQVGDSGILKRQQRLVFRVSDTLGQGKTYLHIGRVEKEGLKIGEVVEAVVDAPRRAAIVLNHTATHLLHLVLRQVLGEHVIQKGSLVEPERLRFDFSYGSPLTAEEISLVEQKVNEEIRANHEAIVRISTPQEALAQGAMGLFEEKYGKQVRVVGFGPSVELCGGTHAERTGDIGLFKITSEAGIAAGIRRIEALTGKAALEWIEKKEAELKQKNEQFEERLHFLEKQAAYLKEKLAQALGQQLGAEAKEIKGFKVLATIVSDLDTKAVRILVDQLKNKLGSAVVALVVVKEQKMSVIVGVTPQNSSQIKANELVNFITLPFGGKGGGRAELAEGGGSLTPEKNLKDLQKILDSVYDWVKEKLQECK
ncbi:MAG TPA: DHHA1 domain-containing protein, partial [Gammaproteobacteria bacterium]|nr:DHHA1 domain-containing protein [Gammaproteobacteria bacterium]